MDLMKTLLIYMSATLTLAVQNTTAPKETPVPTQVPQAIVESIGIPTKLPASRKVETSGSMTTWKGMIIEAMNTM